MAEPLNPKKIPSALPWYRDEWERSTVDHLKDVNAKLTACRFIEETGELELQVGDDVYRFGHVEDCCESVWLADDDGLAGHVGKTLLTVEEVTEKGETEWGTHTYTFYHFKFPDAVAVVRWCGESNGYYSESVGLVKAVAAEEASEDVTGSATIVAPGEEPPGGYTPIAGGDPYAYVIKRHGGLVELDDTLAALDSSKDPAGMPFVDVMSQHDDISDALRLEQRCIDLISNAPPAEPPTLEEMVAAIDELENQIATYEPPSVRRVVILKGAPIDVVPLGDTLYMSEGAFQHLKKEGLKAFAPSVVDLTGIPVVDGTEGEDP